MQEEFIPYEQSLALKELGFDEPCLAFWNGIHLDLSRFNAVGEPRDIGRCMEAPLYQQAFEWFREKPFAVGYVRPWSGHWTYIIARNRGDIERNRYSSYGEAELACLKKLIELAKSRQ